MKFPYAAVLLISAWFLFLPSPSRAGSARVPKKMKARLLFEINRSPAQAQPYGADQNPGVRSQSTSPKALGGSPENVSREDHPAFGRGYASYYVMGGALAGAVGLTWIGMAQRRKKLLEEEEEW